MPGPEFSFNEELYRQQLADEVRAVKEAAGSEQAKDLLNSKRPTDKYQIAQEIHRIKSATKREAKNAVNDFIDVSAQIPDELKIYIDQQRVEELTGKSLSSTNSPERLRMLQEQTVALVDRLTNGAFSNPNTFNTVVHAGTSMRSGYENKKWFSNKQGELHGRTFDPHERIKGASIYAAAGSSGFIMPDKEVVIIDPNSKKFRNNLLGISDATNHRLSSSLTLLEQADFSEEAEQEFEVAKGLEIAQRDPMNGVIIYFNNMPRANRGERDVTWRDIATWIVDLPNGKLYHFDQE
jgi:hypothetical protein